MEIFTVDPAMIDHMEDLRVYGVAYHATLDTIDFMERSNEEARGGQYVSLYSPCNAIDLLRSFYSEDIVGVRIHSVTLFLKYSNRDPFGMATSGALLGLVSGWHPQWKEEQRKEKPGNQTEKNITRAEVMHGRAVEFFRKYPDAALIPPAILKKIIEAWRKSFFSTSSIN